MRIGSTSESSLGISESAQKKTKRLGKKSKKRKSKKEMANVVKNLYQTCREVFANGGAGYIPPPPDIERLKSLLDGMRPEDVNLAPDMPFFRANSAEAAPRITYIHIYECNKFSIGIFCLPPSAVIPLHNHPGMTVFSKLLFGTMRIKSYDWVDTAVSSINENADQTRNLAQLPNIRLAKVHADSDFTAPCDTSVLFPAAGGNMHCFRALTPCAIIDVLGPPYSESEGLHCTYYQDFSFSSFSGALELPPGEDRNKYAWLEEREKPEHFAVVGAVHHCTQILEH